METLHPGLYVQNVQGTPAMEGVSTSTGAFVGVAPKGVVGAPTFITSWAQFVREYGSYIADSYLAYAVFGFFQNGGKRCYISRVVHYANGVKTSAKAVLDLHATVNSVDTIVAVVSAKSDGVWGNDIQVAITAGSTATTFNVEVSYKGVVVEKFSELDTNTLEEMIATSNYIDIVQLEEVALPVTVKTSLAGGNDGLVGLADTDFVGDPATKNGLYAFDSVKINLVAVSGVTTLAVLKGLIAYAEGRGDCIAFLDSPKGQTPQKIDDFVKKTANLASEDAGIYYPWLSVSDPIGVGKSPTKYVPPSGHMMGVTARMDSTVGCWRAPAGTDADLLGVLDVEYNVSDNEQDLLNPDSINCIRSIEGSGIVPWGARTLSKGEYKYIPVRRTKIFVAQSLLANLNWTVFRPNDPPLWNATKNSVENFLTGLWSQGGLRGTSQKDAFFVVCDDSINTDASVDEGKMYVDIGICPQKPAEFVIFRLGLTR